MDYKRLSLIKKNVYGWLTTKINESDYTVGEGAGEVKFTNAFPKIDDEGNFLEIAMPAVALDFSRNNARKSEEMGVACNYRVEFEIDIFARNELERETLLSIIKDALELGSIPYRDYNSVVEITPLLSYLRVSTPDAIPIRKSGPGILEENRGRLFFSVSLLQDY